MENFDAIATNHSDIGEVFPDEGAEQFREPGFIQVNRDDIEVRFAGGHSYCRRSRPRSDFENGGGGPAEPAV
ncbi:MAG: hypothetical protein E7L41_21945, partial [Escherichia coli]|nr:hypothetical protein [Escherichia coli]